jgi:hypothetical protein
LIRARYEFNERWALSADYSHVVPASFLQKTSIFWVFSDSSIDEFTVDLAYTPDLDWRYHVYVRGDYFEDGGHAQGVGGGFDYLYGYHRENAVGLDLLYLSQDHEDEVVLNVGGDLFQARAFQRQEWTEKIFTALDLVGDFFINDTFDTNSYTASVLLGYRFTPMIILVLGVDYLNTVQYEDRVDVHAKVSYAF